VPGDISEIRRVSLGRRSVQVIFVRLDYDLAGSRQSSSTLRAGCATARRRDGDAGNAWKGLTMRLRGPMHLHLAALFAGIFLLVAAVTALQGERSTRRMLESSAADLLEVVDREVDLQLERAIESATLATTLLSRTGLGTESDRRRLESGLPVLQSTLDSSSVLSSVYLGFGNGDMFMLRRLRDAEDQAFFHAPPAARYLLQRIEHRAGGVRGRFTFLDAELQALREEERGDYAAAYDPRSRSWFRDALSSGRTVTSEPYVFHTTHKVGLTVATPVAGAPAVVGADIRLESLGALFKAARRTPGTQMALVTPDARMFAHEDASRLFVLAPDGQGPPRMRTLAESGVPVLQALHATVQALGPKGRHAGAVQAGSRDWRVVVTPVGAAGGTPLHLVLAIPDDELLATARAERARFIWTVLVIVVAAIVAVMLASRSFATPVRGLAVQAERIRHFDFGGEGHLRSTIAEVDDLAATMDGMKATIRRFLTLTEAVASEADFEQLLPLLLAETLEAAHARAGVLYLFSEGRLEPAAARWAGRAQDVQGLVACALPDAQSLVGAALGQAQSRLAALSEAQRLALGLTATEAAFEHALAVPLLNRQREPVGCLLLLRDTPFDWAQVSFIRALSGSAASSLEARSLIRQQKALFEAFIRLIAGAIDAKSPYTGGHCERVPELTRLLAQAACAQTSGAFATFRMDAEDWEALHVAAWLHDCGKITTPEHVVDKATKLETLHDRIHEVRMRFEVLKRDAEIACLRAMAAGHDEAVAKAGLRDALRQLDEEFAFVAACNEGGEFMGQPQRERLQTIAGRTWMRTLDDRIGISQEEKRRKAREPAQALPVAEPLLADKPEHRIEHEPALRRSAELQRLGVRMTVPPLRYNRGELHNLAVSRGTLTEEDRYKINEHIVQTIVMLSQLPFPQHLRQVPEFAGAHHEKLDGTGYPRGLTGGQMSPVARMMAIADIFEALTAADRPYKPAKPLSQALDIMARMACDGHIDGELFEIFLLQGVWREYAARFLPPGQVDDVDVEALLRQVQATRAAPAQD
jgi:response regulator RpfG family c-di-GMP phosphodiesterase